MTDSSRDSQRRETCIRFINFLIELRDSDNGRAAMAVLRRGVGKTPEEAYELNKYLARWIVNDDPKHQWLHRTRFTIASLFGAYPDQVTDEGSMGSHLAKLCQDHSQRATTIERQLMRLLAAAPDDLDRHLYAIISLLQSKEVSVNWVQLMLDILDWRFPESMQRVKSRWSYDFWSKVEDESTEQG